MFGDFSVGQILNKSKTQTRRVITDKHRKGEDLNDVGGAARVLHRCPYGQRGDRLWIRERWGVSTLYDALPPREINSGAAVGYSVHKPKGLKMRPAMYMPRWASRINLEVTALSIDRLQNISLDDMRGEGAGMLTERGTAQAFRNLWNEVNGKRGYGWDKNCWVWAIEFERIKP